MEDSARGSGLPAEMHGVRASDNGYQEAGGEEHERAPETGIVRGRISYRLYAAGGFGASGWPQSCRLAGKAFQRRF